MFGCDIFMEEKTMFCDGEIYLVGVIVVEHCVAHLWGWESGWMTSHLVADFCFVWRNFMAGKHLGWINVHDGRHFPVSSTYRGRYNFQYSHFFTWDIWLGVPFCTMTRFW